MLYEMSLLKVAGLCPQWRFSGGINMYMHTHRTAPEMAGRMHSSMAVVLADCKPQFDVLVVPGKHGEVMGEMSGWTGMKLLPSSLFTFGGR